MIWWLDKKYIVYSPKTEYGYSKNEDQREDQRRVSSGQHLAEVQHQGDAEVRQHHLHERCEEPRQRVPAQVHAHHRHELQRRVLLGN